MKIKLLLTIVITAIFAVSGTAMAKPGNGKGNTKVVIEHTPPSDEGSHEGSVELEVSVVAAVAHIGHGDCVVADPSDALPDENDCGDIPLPPE